MVTNDAMGRMAQVFDKQQDEIDLLRAELFDLRAELFDNQVELREMKEQLSTCLDHVEYAQAMGWDDRAQEAIGQLGELL